MADDDLQPVVGLLSAALGPAPGGVDRRALFEWKHLANPFGPSIALVAEMEGEIVGLRSFMRWRFATPGGGEVHAVRAVDTATSPVIQRRGVFSRLTREALSICEAERVGFVFNTPNERSLPGYMKMGWSRVARWPMWLKVRRPLRVLGAAARRDLRSGRAVPPPTGAPFRPFADLAPARAAFAAPEGRLHTSRTPEYLEWRYARGPVPYHAAAAPGALAIVRLRARGGLREAVVCEALCEPGSERALGGLLRSVARSAKADHAVGHFGPGWAARDALGRAGYHRLPGAGMTFTARAVSTALPDPLAADSWSLTAGDLELF